jgi:hypothetical protein
MTGRRLLAAILKVASAPLESDIISFRDAITASTAEVPELVVIFTIDKNGDVTLQHIEEYVR